MTITDDAIRTIRDRASNLCETAIRNLCDIALGARRDSLPEQIEQARDLLSRPATVQIMPAGLYEGSDAEHYAVIWRPVPGMEARATYPSLELAERAAANRLAEMRALFGATGREIQLVRGAI